MEIEEFCPHCDELIKVDVTEDYWEFKHGEQIEMDDKCPECNKELCFSWGTKAYFDLETPEVKEI